MYTGPASPQISIAAAPAARPVPGYDIATDLLRCGDGNSVLTDFVDTLPPAHRDRTLNRPPALQLQQASYEHATAVLDQPAPSPAHAYVCPADVFAAPYPGSPASSEATSGSTSPTLSTASPIFSEFSMPLTASSSSSLSAWSSDTGPCVATEQAWLVPEMLSGAAGTCASVLFAPVACAAPAPATQLPELSLPSLLSSASAAEFLGLGLNLGQDASLLSRSQSQCYGDQLGRVPSQTIVEPSGGQQVAKKRGREDDEELQLPAKKSRVSQSSKPTPNNIKKRSAHGAESLVRRATPVALRSPKCKAMDATTEGQVQSHIHGNYHTGEVKGPEMVPFGQTPQTEEAEPRLYCAPCNKTFKRPIELARHLKQTKAHATGYACPIDDCDSCLSRIDAVRRHLCSQHEGWEAIIEWRPSEMKQMEN
ncbi:hypothetical protein DENSPDRAFT_64757 [Dentipellis sp. KUC8613]|nr:hypothetical protein DENSPDRAFT_64757 [Dentipellis sp. KUC8613]